MDEVITDFQEWVTLHRGNSLTVDDDGSPLRISGDLITADSISASELSMSSETSRRIEENEAIEVLLQIAKDETLIVEQIREIAKNTLNGILGAVDAPSIDEPVWFDPNEENLTMETEADHFDRQLAANPEAGAW